MTITASSATENHNQPNDPKPFLANPSSAALFSRMAITSPEDEETSDTEITEAKLLVAATTTACTTGCATVCTACTPAIIATEHPSTSSSTVSCSSKESEALASIINKKRFQECYRQEKRLQNGSYGVVFQASRIVDHKNNKNSKDKTAPTQFAVKVIDRRRLKDRDDHAVFREVRILKELVDVPNVITLVDFFVEPQTLYVVLTLATGGDVFDRLVQRKTYTEHFARELAKVLLNTLSIMHERGIVHRDLKPGNLLLANDADDCSILLADFGFATHLDPKTGSCRTRCGTPCYVAPEIILDVPYTQTVDMWSCGCILYLLLCGYPPFRGDHHRDLFRRIRAGNFTFHEASWTNVSIPAKQLIAHLLTVNPKHRWTAKQALESSWVTGTAPAASHLKENDLSEALTRIRSRRKLKSAMDAVRWAATARFWNPEKVTFSQQMQKWDKSLMPNKNNNNMAHHDGAAGRSGSSLGTTASLGTTTTNTMPPPPAKPVRLANFVDRYTLLRKVRKGAYATVWECKLKEASGQNVGESEEVFAVKVIPRPCLSTDHDEQVLNEVAILQSLSAEAPESIVKLVDFYEEDDAFYVVMEYMTGGDVFDRVVQKSYYSEQDACDLIKCLLQAVEVLHQKGIAHRDIKPQNLLLPSKDNDCNIKLCDFGFARRVHTPQSLTQRVGTPPFVSPEILKNIPHDERVDMWSVGVTSFVLLVGYPPFAHENREMVCQQIKAGAWRFHDPDWKRISPEARELITGLLQVDPVERLTASEALQSKWIQQSGKCLSSRDLTPSLKKLKSENRDLRASAQKTLMWFANKTGNVIQHGFVSKPITSPTQANESLIVEDSIGNIEVKKY